MAAAPVCAEFADGGRRIFSEKHPSQGITCILDYNNARCTVIGEIRGFWKVVNMTGNSDSILAFALNGGYVELTSTVTTGIFLFVGNGELDNSMGGTPFLWTDYLIRGSDTQVLKADSAIDITTDPWTEKWTREGYGITGGTGYLATFDLFDEVLAPLNNGNPISGKYVRRRQLT